jgi:hypothetical protein
MTTPTFTMDPAEVQVGTANGPGIYIAPAGTAMPVDTTAPFAAPWDILGYLSDDGPTVGQSTDSNEIVPWQSVVPLRSVITKRSVTLGFVLWQLNQRTLGVYFDADPPTPAADGSIDMEIRTDTPQHLYAIAIDAADAERVLRIGFTRSSLTDAGDMQLKRGEAVPLDCKLTALDDAGVLARVLLGPATSGTTMATSETVVRSGKSG